MRLMFSYARYIDTFFAHALADQLSKSPHHTVWIDRQETVKHGERWPAIAQAIEDADCLLVLLTAGYRMSRRSLAEVDYAIEHQKRLIVLQRYDVDVPLSLQGVEVHDIRSMSAEHAAQVCINALSR